MRALGIRPHLIGDSVMAAVIPPYLKRRFGNDLDMHWVVSAKCSQAAPLFLNHPALDRVWVSTASEGYGPRELEIAKSCSIVFDPLPQHPDGDSWPNQVGRTIYSETWLMAGLPLREYEALPKDEQVPRLYPWFKIERRPKTIAIWPGARQGEKEDRRNAPFPWWNTLTLRLIAEGYTVVQCGHPNDMGGQRLPEALDARERSFMDLVALSAGCDLTIGTDSGSMVALAALGAGVTLSLINPHWRGHTSNPLCFAPLGPRHVNLCAPSNHDHDLEKVVDTVRQLT